MMLACVWLIVAASASATPPPERDGPIDTIIVEASKTPTTASELASSVTTIDTQRIRYELGQGIEDLVRYEPGIDVINQGSRFGNAGFSIRGVGGNRVHIEIDGVPAADAFSIGAFSNASRDYVDVDMIKQVEIVRGPASAVFGSDALGGVVSFVTQGPEDLAGDGGWYLDAGAGYVGVDHSQTARTTLAWNDDTSGGLLRVSVRESAERDAPLVDPLDDQSLNVFGKFRFGPSRDGAIEVTAEHFVADTLTDVNSLEGVEDFSAAFGFPFVVDRSRVAADDTKSRSRLSLTQQWLDGMAGTDFLRWRAYYQDSETRQDTLEDRVTNAAGSASAELRERSFRFAQSLSGIEVNAASAFDVGSIAQELSYGLEIERTRSRQIRDGQTTNLQTGEISNVVVPDEFPVRDFPKSTTTRWGAYLQSRIDMGQITLLPGLRWDRFELSPEPDEIFTADNPMIDTVELNDQRVSPKLGMLWSMTDRTQLYVQYAEGFRAPPVNDVNIGFTNFQFGYTTLPNPDLKSETSANIEIGARHHGEVINWSLATFRTHYDDFIESLQLVDFDPVNNLLVFQSVNLDDVEIIGVEASMDASLERLLPGLTIRASAAYAEGENRANGRPLASVAPLNGVLGADFRAPSERWGLSLVASAAMRQDGIDPSAGALPAPAGYVVYDTFGYWQASDNITLRAGIYNLGDHTYNAYLDLQGLPANTPSPERFQRPGRYASVAFEWRL
ncbi:MAG: TonB-dependent hemoglobin/transferrin/lactoferrin family receptor [Pseudomonadota bacterium]